MSQREFSGHDLSSVRILIVDDDKLNRRISTLQLSSYGAQCYAVASSEDAFSALAQVCAKGDPFQNCVIDQMMPVTDGTALLRMIRSHSLYNALKTIPSSSAGVRTDTDARELGFDAAVPKPVNQELLVQSASELLSERAEASHEAEFDSVREARAGSSANLHHNDRHVLIVEDNVANLKLACLILEQAGYTFDKAINGVEAFAAATRFTYAAVLIVIGMPDIDSFEASKRIRKSPGARSEEPIIAITARIAEYSGSKLQEVGVAAIVPKPIDEMELLTVLSDLAPSRDSRAA